MAVCIMKRYEAEGTRPADKVAAEWALQYCLAQTQKGFVALFENMHPIFKYTLAPLARLNPIGIMPSDRLGQKLAMNLLESNEFINNLTDEIFIPKDEKDHLNKLERARSTVIAADGIMAKIKAAIKAKELPKGRAEDLTQQALEKNIISQAEFDDLKKFKELWLDAIMVDSWEIDDYIDYSMKTSV